MNKNICAPNKYDSENDTCFSLDQVIELIKAFNKHITKINLSPTTKVSYDATPIKISDNKSQMLTDLNNRFISICSGKEMCLLKQDFMNEIVDKNMYNDITTNTFRVKGPDGSTDWLSTIDIDGIMHQYEEVYSDFHFLGAVPSDCDAVDYCVLHDINFDDELNKGINRLGIIFNHDTHKQSGSHWVSMFIDIPKATLYYVDSVGKDPVGRINKFIDTFKKYSENKGKKFVYKKNKFSYQTDDSECGIYSCNFLIRLLAGESFEHIIENPLDFKAINSCRNIYFNNPISKANAHKMCDPHIAKGGIVSNKSQTSKSKSKKSHF
jgi:hypothetical protein